jgi:hypothetical protein
MSDSSDRNIVLLIFVGMFIYLYILRIKTLTLNDWSNMKCNPLILWSNSFVKDPIESKNDFKNCIINMTDSTVNDSLNQAYLNIKTQTDEINTIKSSLDENLIKIDSHVTDMNTKYGTTKNNIDNLNTNIATMNDINSTISTPDSSTNGLYSFANTINTIFNNINSYLPSM